ncbi:MAG: hypothetical protein V3U24_01615 [Candidatus Neomarinimicrobiota bacterium]
MAKGKSFADKIKQSGAEVKQFSIVKYVKSVVSEKTGQYRFQEKMLRVPVGTDVETFINQLEKGSQQSKESERETVSTSETEEPVVDEKKPESPEAVEDKEEERES